MPRTGFVSIDSLLLEQFFRIGFCDHVGFKRVLHFAQMRTEICALKNKIDLSAVFILILWLVSPCKGSRLDRFNPQFTLDGNNVF